MIVETILGRLESRAHINGNKTIIEEITYAQKNINMSCDFPQSKGIKKTDGPIMPSRGVASNSALPTK